MQDARAAYLETQVLTAAPQKLRLMLIEGCMRFARQAREAQASGNAEQFSTSLERARDIVAELIAGIRPDLDTLSTTARALYAFIFKLLAEAQLLGEGNKIDDALRVLEEERQTWLQVCELALEPPTANDANHFRQQEIVAGDTQTPSVAASGFSIDA